MQTVHCRSSSEDPSIRSFNVRWKKESEDEASRSSRRLNTCSFAVPLNALYRSAAFADLAEPQFALKPASCRGKAGVTGDQAAVGEAQAACEYMHRKAGNAQPPHATDGESPGPALLHLRRDRKQLPLGLDLQLLPALQCSGLARLAKLRLLHPSCMLVKQAHDQQATSHLVPRCNDTLLFVVGDAAALSVRIMRVPPTVSLEMRAQLQKPLESCEARPFHRTQKQLIWLLLTCR
eukprot:CAMPEP_0115112346 /NCGR_PEP_ID=MMETSP0227-20121206/40615_1 /TAXON_ID=89957 /ORGANISM="Polarella glacialis, Strain CCMP 1383" /LENGTH=234 /DNA_ID=CAMNT_0002511955 /DNA_START=89 /DNA_END=791 /DNA_ORIENTATION=+